MPTTPSSRTVRRSLVTWLWAGAALGGCQMTVATEVQDVRRHHATVQGIDADGDGVSVVGGDCDDADATIFPGALEQCDGVDNDCTDGVDDGGACLATRSITQTMRADVLLVLDTHEGMDPLLVDFGDYAYELGQEIGGSATDVNVGVVSMDASGDLFSIANRSFVAAGTEDGANRVTEWVRAAIDGLPVASTRGRGRDSVLALLVDSAEAEVETQAHDTGTGAKSAEEIAGAGGSDGPGLSGAFRRDDAPLTVVFVSRTDDASTASVEAFASALVLMAEEGRAVHALVGRGGDCGEASGSGEGSSYVHLAESTGGVVHDVCELDGSVLRDVGEAIAASGLATIHKLPADLDPSRPTSLTAVRPDGMVLDFEPNSYSIDVEEGRMLVFVPPPAGSVLTLAYERMP